MNHTRTFLRGALILKAITPLREKRVWLCETMENGVTLVQLEDRDIVTGYKNLVMYLRFSSEEFRESFIFNNTSISNATCAACVYTDRAKN